MFLGALWVSGRAKGTVVFTFVKLETLDATPPYGARLPFVANGLLALFAPIAVTLPCATGVSPKSLVKPRYAASIAPVVASPAVHS